MKCFLLFYFFILGVSFAQSNEPFDRIDWTYGPALVQVGEVAEIEVPSGYLFTGENGTQEMMEYFQNPLSGAEVGFLMPDSGDWFVVFEYSDTGYVSDDDKEDIHPDKMLRVFKSGTVAGNKVRRENGWGAIEVTGWAMEPSYNIKTNNLEWATIIRDVDSGILNTNFNTRLLGRNGVMSLTLVTDVDQLDNTLQLYHKCISNFRYTSGNRYAEWKSGDKIAEYGLTGLMIGGGAAIAAKSGILTKLLKFLFIPIIIGLGYIKKLFTGNK